LSEQIGVWTDQRAETLRELWQRGLSAKQIAAMLGNGISRNAVVSKVRRMDLTRTEGHEVRLRANGPKRIRKKHPAGYVRPRSNRDEERKRNAKLMLAGGARKTSAAYRKHLPRIGEMTRNELRAMLTTAIQNTANMGQTL
jgi:hypothetical protein